MTIYFDLISNFNQDIFQLNSKLFESKNVAKVPFLREAFALNFIKTYNLPREILIELSLILIRTEF